MHEIQLDILKRITLCPESRYIELKNEDVDSNLFMYHLNQLMHKGLIIKNENKKYVLTNEGRRYISLLSTKSGELRKQPQILVMLYCRNEKDQLLLFKWKREPNANLVSLPHGMLHFGTSPKEMAAEELKEKCNLEGELTYRGDIYLKIWSDKELFNHMIYHVFEVSNYSGDLKSNTVNGECLWGRIEDFTEVELMPGTWEVLDIIAANQQDIFFAEAESVL